MTEEKMEQIEKLRREIYELKQLISHLDGSYSQGFPQDFDIKKPDEVLLNYPNGRYQIRIPAKYIRIELPDLKEIKNDLRYLQDKFNIS